MYLLYLCENEDIFYVQTINAITLPLGELMALHNKWQLVYKQKSYFVIWLI